MAENGLKKKQYTLINAMRLIASFFVVAIHIHFSGEFGNAVIGFARFAVPFFFMVSGFFSYYEDSTVIDKKMKHKIRHTLSLTLLSLFLYFAYRFALYVLGNGGISLGVNITEFLKKQITVGSIVKFLLFNEVGVSTHLWFLPALLYVYVIFYVFLKTDFAKKSLFLIPVLLGIGIVVRELIEHISMPDIFYEAYIYRNFLFIGLPFFLLGYHIKRNEKLVTEKMSDLLLLSLFVIGSAEAIFAMLFYTSKSIYVGSVFAVFGLFVFVIKNEGKIKCPRIASAGAKYSLYIYILHIIVRDFIRKIESIIPLAENITDALASVMPVIIFACTLIVSAIYVSVKTAVKQKIKKREK